MSSSRTPFIHVGLSRLEWVTLLAVDPHASTVTVPYASTHAHICTHPHDLPQELGTTAWWPWWHIQSPHLLVYGVGC